MKFNICTLKTVLMLGMFICVFGCDSKDNTKKIETKQNPDQTVGGQEEVEEIKRSTALGSQTFVLPEVVKEAESDSSGSSKGKKSGTARHAEGGKKARVKESGWNCLGSIGASDAVKVIKQNKRAVRTCYEKRLRVDNTLQGKVNLKLRVNQSGNVEAVQLGGSMRDREVKSCIRKIAQKWKFPKPKGGKCAVLSAPYNLTPRS